MSHEIYYTSAPGGLRSHSSGFCTVAATDGIPRPLIERLETLSAYRHHAPRTAGHSPDARSPVSHAHWIIRLAGREHHVLSRICDSGLDYTHRTNFFAHHLLLDADELHAAGPAWLLRQPGVMRDQWDGHVGTIVRAAALPGAGAPQAAGPCTTWQSLTGDAGWAGVLAESFVQQPGRPVVLYFTAGQPMLPLLEEAIALLPPGQRWQVTFNTYFTSQPSSAVCTWRCCLIDDPATARPPRGALVINLARPGEMSTPPDTDFVRAARSGQPLSRASDGSAPASARSIVHFAAGSRPAARRRLGEKLPPPQEIEEEVDLYELVPADIATGGPPPIDQRRIDDISSGAATRGRSEGRTGSVAASSPRRSAASSLRLYLAAVLALGLGTFLLARAYQPPPRDLPLAPLPAGPRASDAMNAADPPPPPVVETPVQPPAPQPEPPPAPIVAPVPETPEPIEPEPPAPPPRTIVLDTPLRQSDAPAVGEATQTIAIPPDHWDNPGEIASFALLFPNERTEYAVNVGDLAGTLSIAATPGAGASGFALSVRWLGRGEPGTARVVMNATLDPMRSRMEIAWPAGVLQSRPDVARLTYWIVQNSSFVVSDVRNERPQRIRFSPIELPVRLADEITDLPHAVELPAGCVPALEGDLPQPWQARRVAASASAGAAQPAPHMLRLYRAVGDELPGDLTLTFDPGFTAVRSNFAGQRQRARDLLLQYRQDLAGFEEQLRRLHEQAMDDISINETALAEYEALTEEEMHRRGMSEDGRQHEIARLRRLINERLARLEGDSAASGDGAADSQRQITRYDEVLRGYEGLSDFDVAIALPDGTPLMVLNFRSPR